MTEAGREGWSPEERALYDARAESEAWDFAWRILEPWVQSAREIGSAELTQAMEKALEVVDAGGNRAQDELERLISLEEGRKSND